MRSTRRAVPVLAAATAASLILTAAAPTVAPNRLLSAQSQAAVSAKRTVTVDVLLVAAVVEKPSTVGIAESALYTLSAQDLDKQIQVLKDAGVTDVRIAVPWVYIQPTSPDSYDWSKMDAVIDKLHEEGFSITASVTSNPAWNGIPLAGAPSPATYSEFVGKTAERYAGKISAYEVWNEPNGALFYTPVSPESYTELLKAAYASIKENDPDAIVVGGVLGSVKTFPGVSMAPQEFLDRMYQSGAAGYFDALSFHPYHYTTPFSQGGGITDSPMEQVKALRALMVANGDADKLIWATEYGVPTTPFFGLSEAQQAAFMRDFIAAWQNVEGAGPAFLYSGYDLNTGAWDNEANFGLWDSNFNPKKFAEELALIQQQLADGTFDTSFTASEVPFPQALFIQATSLVLGILNPILSVPRSIIYTVQGLAAQAFQALVDTVQTIVRTITGQPTTAQRSVDTDAPEVAGGTTSGDDETAGEKESNTISVANRTAFVTSADKVDEGSTDARSVVQKVDTETVDVKTEEKKPDSALETVTEEKVTPETETVTEGKKSPEPETTSDTAASVSEKAETNEDATSSAAESEKKNDDAPKPSTRKADRRGDRAEAGDSSTDTKPRVSPGKRDADDRASAKDDDDTKPSSRGGVRNGSGSSDTGKVGGSRHASNTGSSDKGDKGGSDGSSGD